MGTPAPCPDWQRVAAALALARRLTVISGGPGTGKTTTVVNVLACLIEQQPECRIALAAPTGKAAARMMEAVSARASTLPDAVRDRLPVEAQTIHRLLGVTPRGDGFRHHAGNRLPIDVLIVDEASMLDLALATHLIEAVPDGVASSCSATRTSSRRSRPALCSPKSAQTRRSTRRRVPRVQPCAVSIQQ